MDKALLINPLIFILIICVLIFLIIKLQNKKYLHIPLIFVLGLTILGLTIWTLITIPSYISMKERTWPESSNVFSDLSKQYMTNNKPMVLNHNYKTKLTNQFFRLRQEYGFTRGKEKMISILSYVLEKELPKSGENIDTMMLFDKIQKIISDSLKSNNSGG